MRFPERSTFRPDYGLTGPHRARRRRGIRNTFIAAAVLGGLIVARLYVRHFLGA